MSPVISTTRPSGNLPSVHCTRPLASSAASGEGVTEDQDRRPTNAVNNTTLSDPADQDCLERFLKIDVKRITLDEVCYTTSDWLNVIYMLFRNTVYYRY